MRSKSFIIIVLMLYVLQNKVLTQEDSVKKICESINKRLEVFLKDNQLRIAKKFTESFVKEIVIESNTDVEKKYLEDALVVFCKDTITERYKIIDETQIYKSFHDNLERSKDGQTDEEKKYLTEAVRLLNADSAELKSNNQSEIELYSFFQEKLVLAQKGALGGYFALYKMSLDNFKMDLEKIKKEAQAFFFNKSIVFLDTEAKKQNDVSQFFSADKALYSLEDFYRILDFYFDMKAQDFIERLSSLEYFGKSYLTNLSLENEVKLQLEDYCLLEDNVFYFASVEDIKLLIDRFYSQSINRIKNLGVSRTARDIYLQIYLKRSLVKMRKNETQEFLIFGKTVMVQNIKNAFAPYIKPDFEEISNAVFNAFEDQPLTKKEKELSKAWSLANQERNTYYDRWEMFEQIMAIGFASFIYGNVNKISDDAIRFYIDIFKEWRNRFNRYSNIIELEKLDNDLTETQSVFYSFFEDTFLKFRFALLCYGSDKDKSVRDKLFSLIDARSFSSATTKLYYTKYISDEDCLNTQKKSVELIQQYYEVTRTPLQLRDRLFLRQWDYANSLLETHLADDLKVRGKAEEKKIVRICSGAFMKFYRANLVTTKDIDKVVLSEKDFSDFEKLYFDYIRTAFKYNPIFQSERNKVDLAQINASKKYVKEAINLEEKQLYEKIKSYIVEEILKKKE